MSRATLEAILCATFLVFSPGVSAFASEPEVVVTTLAGMDGPNGGWAQTHGSTVATSTSLYLSIDEDQVGDSERNHITEQVGYIAFGSTPNTPPVADDLAMTLFGFYVFGQPH